MLLRSLVFQVLTFWIVHKVNYNDAVLFKLSNAVCESYNQSFVVINKCRLKAVSRNRTTFNFNCTFLHPAANIRVEMRVLKKASGYKPWVINADIDVCRFLKKAYNPIAITTFNLFKEFSNFNSTCPLIGDQIVDGFYLRPNLLRLPFPTGEYLVTGTWMLNQRPQLITNISAIYVED